MVCVSFLFFSAPCSCSSWLSCQETGRLPSSISTKCRRAATRLKRSLLVWLTSQRFKARRSIGRGVPFSAPLVSYRGPSRLFFFCCAVVLCHACRAILLCRRAVPLCCGCRRVDRWCCCVVRCCHVLRFCCAIVPFHGGELMLLWYFVIQQFSECSRRSLLPNLRSTSLSS